MKVTFYGGTETVTGSNVLVESQGDKKTKILLDCGLYQGSKINDEHNYDSFPFDPKSIDALFVSHAHLDHTGRIPRLVAQGFRGKIYSSPPTKEIAELLLVDSLGILTKQSEADGRPPLYSNENVEESMSVWGTHKYNESFEVGDFTITFHDAGHVLGSAMTSIVSEGKKLVYTGDLGNSPSPLLPDTEKMLDADYIIMESVYGDREHEHLADRSSLLEDVIEDTMNRGGVLMIPAFSFERTQELLFEIGKMMGGSRIPLVPVYLDSPLAIKVTDVYKRYLSYYKELVKKDSGSDNDLFGFPQLHQTLRTEDSKAINNKRPPKIIIAGSGMSNGGRIVHHERQYLKDPRNTLLIFGYQAPGTLGRILQDGVKWVKIFGEDIPVRAQVVTITGYSGHKDASQLLLFARDAADNAKKFFVIMGEPRASLSLVQKIRDNLGVMAIAPKKGESYEL